MTWAQPETIRIREKKENHKVLFFILFLPTLTYSCIKNLPFEYNP
jgi:hypothetical protein